MARRRDQVARGTQESRADVVRLGGSGMERSQRRGPSSWVKRSCCRGGRWVPVQEGSWVNLALSTCCEKP